MKLCYFNLLSSLCDCSSFDQNKILTSQSPFRAMVYFTAGLTLILMLASCVEKPSGRVQISNELMMALAKKIPTQQSADPAAFRIVSDFGKTILKAVEANERYRAALSMEKALMADIAVAESVRRWQVKGSSTAGGISERGGSQPSKTTTGIAGGINASQLIYDGGESVANINSATAEAVGARIDRIIVGNELALETARAWIDVWQYSKKLDLLKTRSMEMEMVVSLKITFR